MIACFPEPYPDETFYSLCARYAERMGYADVRMALRDLFDTPSGGTYWTPTHLSRLVAALPPGHQCTVKDLIENTSMRPYFARLVPWIKTSELLEVMPQQMKVCDDCTAFDRATYGEAYWHRVHQCPGVILCHLHGTPLRRTAVVVDGRLSDTRDLITAQSVLIGPHLPRYVVRRKWRHVAQAVAEDSARLFANSGPALERSELSSFYRQVMFETTLVRKNGTVDSRRVINEFYAFCPRRLAILLGCDRAGRPRNDDWPVRLAKSSSAITPVRHLLMIRFLGMNPDSFFTRIGAFLPFGDGPWPCLNPTCRHYRKNSIKTVRRDTRTTDRGIVGHFHCKCNFEYSRTAPDLTEVDRYKYDTIEHYGEVWESEFRRLWCNTNVGNRELVARMGVPPADVKRQSKALKLPHREGFDEEVLWPLEAAKREPRWQQRLMEEAAERINVPYTAHGAGCDPATIG